MLLSGLAFLACFYVLPIPQHLQIWIGIAISSIIPAIFGYLFNGGPVFHYTGIQVCNSKGLASKKIICAIRNVLSWLPVIFLIGAVLTSLIQVEAQTNIMKLHLPETPELKAELMESAQMMAIVGIGLLVATVITCVGLVVSIVSPKRGLVDFLLGTRLMPK